MKVHDVYRPLVPTCAPTTRLHAVARQMERAGTGVVAVVDDEQKSLVGVGTERDLVHARAGDVDPDAVVAAAYTTTDVITAALDEDVGDVAHRMVDAGVRRVLVITEEGDLLGVVSMRNLFAIDVLLAKGSYKGEDRCRVS